jgi:hypothetical protein
MGFGLISFVGPIPRSLSVLARIAMRRLTAYGHHARQLRAAGLPVDETLR